ncbi:MAG: hypothetical protein R6V31_08655 [Halohasta sp.]
MERRSLLIGIASASLTIPLAGCADTEENDPDENQGEEDTPTEEDDPTENQGEEDTSTEETQTSDEGADAEFVDEVDGQVQLTYGETAKLSNGVETTVHGVEIEGGTDDHPPEERDAFALVEVESFNDSDGQAPILSETDPGLYVLYEDQQVDQTFNYGLFNEIDKKPYEANEEVQSGVRRDGYILFEVGAGLTEADTDFLWQDSWFVAEDLDGEIDVRWSAK